MAAAVVLALSAGLIASRATATGLQSTAVASTVAAHAASLAAVQNEAAASATDRQDAARADDEGQAVDDIIRSLRRDDPSAPVVQPIDPEVVNRPPGFSDLIAERDRPLLPEGSRVVGVPGRLTRHESTGEWMFVFEAVEGADADPLAPMPVIPCAELERRERLAEDPQFDVQFFMFGEVFVYRDRNYLLPTFIQPAQVNLVEAGDADADINAPTAADGAARRGGDEGGVRGGQRSRDRSGAVRAPTLNDEGEFEGEVLTEALPEGTFLTLRSGRLLRSSVGGEIIFVFDADKDGGGDPPVVLAPSLLLERMEKRAEERSDGVRFLLSGEVLNYHNRNFLIPSMMLVPYERTNLSY